ncbi:MAG: pyridoxine 5'-phosphate synthase [Bacteroidales bacterium]|nr:pyridoxine 5'-phosphate synthase [Candidatus Cryptobacteroides aphodequi]
MTRLSVNINKIATLRNARGGNVPDVLKAAVDIQAFGAEGITVHPRPDGRHILYSDVRALRPLVSTEFNIEGNPEHSFIDLVCEVVPDQVTLVPDAYDAITSNAGWDIPAHAGFLEAVCKRFHEKGIRVSIFIDPVPEMCAAAKAVGADRVEMYTAAYAAIFPTDPAKAIEPYLRTALAARQAGLGLNAGHDLNLDNLAYFIRNIPWTDEVSIGHALISDALYSGLESTVKDYLKATHIL